MPRFVGPRQLLQSSTSDYTQKKKWICQLLVARTDHSPAVGLLLRKEKQNLQVCAQ